MLIIGEIHNNLVKVCLLERISDTWTINSKSYFIPCYTPYFFDIPLNNKKPRTNFKFVSLSGKIRKGSVSNNIESCYVVACNNRHVFYENTIWNQIEDNPVDLILHCGDQIYADRIFWKWFYAFDKCKNNSLYQFYEEDIKKDYYKEYLDTWEPLINILSHTSSIMIPDDHEARSRADIWTENVKNSFINKLNKDIQYYLIDTKTNEKTKYKEEFLFKVAFDLCKELYLGLRFTNKSRFDYINYIKIQNEKILLIMTERITHSLFDDEFYKYLPKFNKNDKVLVVSGLPPVPIRENFFEMLVYRHPQTIPDSIYDKFYKTFEKTNFIAIGGDIHLGSSGHIVNKNTNEKIGILHTTGPSSGFTSFHIIGSDHLGSTNKYKYNVDEFNNSDTNAIYVDFLNFKSHIIFEPSNYNKSIINLIHCAGVFFS